MRRISPILILILILILLCCAGCGQAGPDAGPAQRPRIMVAGLVGDPDAGARLFVQCKACHTVGATAPDTDGPNLHGVVGGPVAQRRPRFAYTAALQATGGVWDVARLDAWLRDPRAAVPGTTMRFAGLADPQQRADVIAYLALQDD